MKMVYYSISILSTGNCMSQTLCSPGDHAVVVVAFLLLFALLDRLSGAGRFLGQANQSYPAVRSWNFKATIQS